MKIKILNVEYHRNGSGVCEGFFAVLFEEKNVPKEWSKGVCGDKFIASFTMKDKDEKQISWESFRVINTKNFNLNFRGDYFINPLIEALQPYCENLKLWEVSFSAAAFPNHYKSK